MRTTASLTSLSAHSVETESKFIDRPLEEDEGRGSISFSDNELTDFFVSQTIARNVLTGSYNNNFHIFDRNGTNDVTLQADKSAFKAKRVGSAKNKMAARPGFKNGKKDDINVESIDFSKKILHASWHPNENSIAVAATNNLFIFT